MDFPIDVSVTAVIGKISPAAPAPERLAVQLQNPVQDKLADYVLTNATTPGLAVVAQGGVSDKTLALCGAGPSLAKYPIEGVDHIWACNSALGYLLQQGVPVTAAVGIDQTPGLLREWEDAPDVLYYLASSCDPALVAYLRDRGRRIQFFHNAVGLADTPDEEVAFYRATFPETVMTGGGFTVVTRATILACWMGYERVDLYGADSAFGPDDQAHANGEIATDAYRNPLIMTGVINGRTYRTRPDMLIGAVDLARRVRNSVGRVRLIGDTLPVQLLGKSEDFLNSVARQVAPDELTTLTGG